MNTFDITLDLDKRGLVQVVPIRQGDKSGTTIRATITDHGAAAATSGLTARFSMRLPDGTHYYRKAASLSGNVATVALDEAQAASVAGRTDVAYFQLLQGSTVVASTESFTVVVLPDALADATVPESYDSAIQDAIDALDAAVEQMPDMVEDVLTDHPEWTTTVQDGSVSDAKLYQGADGILARVGRLQYRLANLLTAQLPEGETATVTDAAQTPVAGLALYGRSTQDGTPTPSAPVPIVSVAAANLLRNNLVTHDGSGVTFVVGEDGTVTMSGTATATANQDIGRGNTVLPAGTYTFGAGTGSGYSLFMYKIVDGTASVIRNSPGTFTLDADTSVFMRIAINSGAVVSGVVSPFIYRGSTAYPYVPYGHAGLWAKRTSDASTYTVTPIDLDGHELRSLPDGTRDEVTVDSRGHAVLVQRVGVLTLDGSESWSLATSNNKKFGFTALPGAPNLTSAQSISKLACSRFAPSSTQDGGTMYQSGTNAIFWTGNGYTPTNSTEAKAWAAANPFEVLYALATPVTIDLGTVDPVPLCGPDLTAQAVPTAPMQLTYERDLNTTLARLESAIATLA